LPNLNLQSAIAKEVPTQRKVETCFISSDLFGPGEIKRNSGWGIAQHVWQNATKKVAKSHISSTPEMGTDGRESESSSG